MWNCIPRSHKSVGTIDATVSESNMAQANISDDDMLLRAFCTVVKEVKTKLEKVKGQLEKDKTETRVLRGMMIHTVKKFAADFNEHYENEYDSRGGPVAFEYDEVRMACVWWWNSGLSF